MTDADARVGSGTGTSTEEAAAAGDPPRGLLDTSVFVARETGRPLGALPQAWAISVVTIAELRLGVLLADDPAIRARRLRTLIEVQTRIEPLPADTAVAGAFAELVAEARRGGRRPKAMDAWIAATAVAHGLPLYTQDNDFDGLPLLQVIHV